MAILMLADLEAWDKNLDNIARMMQNSERKLSIGEGGQKTQKIQKEIISRLDEMIKQLENKKKNKDGEGSENCPESKDGQKTAKGQQKEGQQKIIDEPMKDSKIMNDSGSGKVDITQLKKMTENWGKMPANERAKAMQSMQDLVNGLPPT